MSVFVDTSALYAYLDADDDNNGAAEHAVRSLLGHETLVTHNYVIVETAALVQNRLGPAATRALFQDVLPALRTIWIEEAVHEAAVAALLAASRRRASFVDWVSFELMRREGMTRALAFDRDFAAQGFEAVP